VLPFVYERRDSTGHFAIAINPAKAPCNVTLSELKDAKLSLAEGARLTGTQLALDGVSFAILKLKS